MNFIQLYEKSYFVLGKCAGTGRAHRGLGCGEPSRSLQVSQEMKPLRENNANSVPSVGVPQGPGAEGFESVGFPLTAIPQVRG